jgi:acyl-CoA dehydrogenase
MHGPQSIQPIEDFMAEPEHADGAAHIALDCAGLNFYEIDRGLCDLLPLYVSWKLG